MLQLVKDIAFVSGSHFTVQNNTALTFFSNTNPLRSGEWISELGDTIISSDSAEVIFDKCQN